MVISTKLTADEVSRIYSEHIFELAGTTRQRRKIVCPLPMHKHANYTPSFSIFWADNRWRWCCHGSCNKCGDVIDLAGYLNLPGYDPRDAQMLSKAISLITGDNYQPAAPVAPRDYRKVKLLPTDWQQYYPPGIEVEAYAESRGLDGLTIRHFRVGQHRDQFGVIWMTIPAFEANQLTGIKMRNLGQGLRYKSVKGSRAGIFNYDRVAYKQERIYVVKGEIAAMVLTSRGLVACAPTGGESMKLGEQYQQALALGDIVVIGDNDRDPEVRAKTRVMAKERAESLNAKLFFPPETYKDIDEWILDDPQAIQILKEV